MPRHLKGLRKRGKSYFFRVRAGGSDQTVSLGQDFDQAVIRVLEIRRRLSAGLPPTDERSAILTVADATKSWLEDHVTHARPPSISCCRRDAASSSTRWSSRPAMGSPAPSAAMCC